jgi:hypothetical protein
MYPNLIDNFFYRQCYIYDSKGSAITQLSPGLYMGTSRCRTQVKAI